MAAHIYRGSLVKNFYVCAFFLLQTKIKWTVATGAEIQAATTDIHSAIAIAPHTM
jgi:hypothetical protein